MSVVLVVRRFHGPNIVGRRHAWAQGEVVSIRPDPAPIGNKEPAHFFFITLEGEDIDLNSPICERLAEDGNPDPLDTRSRLSRKRFYFDFSLLPNRVRSQLRTSGTASLRVQERDLLDLAMLERIVERVDDINREP